MTGVQTCALPIFWEFLEVFGRKMEVDPAKLILTIKNNEKLTDVVDRNSNFETVFSKLKRRHYLSIDEMTEDSYRNSLREDRLLINMDIQWKNPDETSSSKLCNDEFPIISMGMKVFYLNKEQTVRDLFVYMFRELVQIGRAHV